MVQNTRQTHFWVNTTTEKRETIDNVGNSGFSGKRTVAKKSSRVRQDMGGASEMPISCCACEDMETAQSLGCEASAVVARFKGASGHRPRTELWSCVGGL